MRVGPIAVNEPILRVMETAAGIVSIELFDEEEMEAEIGGSTFAVVPTMSLSVRWSIAVVEASAGVDVTAARTVQ